MSFEYAISSFSPYVSDGSKALCGCISSDYRSILIMYITVEMCVQWKRNAVSVSLFVLDV